MDWIGKEMAACIKRGNDVVEWVTPSGFHVSKRETITIQSDRISVFLVVLNRVWSIMNHKE